MQKYAKSMPQYALPMQEISTNMQVRCMQYMGVIINLKRLKCEKKNPRRNQSSFLPVFFKYKGLQLGPLQCQAIWLGCQPAVSRVLSNNKEFWKWQILGRKSSLYMQPLQCLHSRSYLLIFHIRIQYSWSWCEIFVLT